MNKSDEKNLIELYMDGSYHRISDEDNVMLSRKDINSDEVVLSYLKLFITPTFEYLSKEKKGKLLESANRVYFCRDEITLRAVFDDDFGPYWDYDDLRDPFRFLKFTIDALKHA